MTEAAPLSIADAQARVLVRFRRLAAEGVDLAAARGRILAADAIAAGDLPAFTNSAMDGYAVRAADTKSASAATPVRLPIVGTLAAGDAPSVVVAPGTAVAIATGAPLPAGADAVIRLEETEKDGDAAVIRAPVAVGANVRAQGESVRGGAAILPAGTALAAGQIALLAAVGIARPAVVRQPRVAILSTGNELVPVGASPGPGQIWDVNAPLLAALVAESGGIPVPCGIARDTPEALRNALRAVGAVDCIVTSGGISVGARDAVCAVLGEHGVVDFRGVAMRPGAPTTFGAFAGVPVLALPGNPVAAFVAFALLARPALARMVGARDEPLRAITTHLTIAVKNRGEVPLLLRARKRPRESAPWGYTFDTTIDQTVGNITALAQTDALIVVPPQTTVARGAPIGAILLGT